ncbi:MAG TPA: ferrichrome ABC transporter permease, partial [Thermoanaerobaculia bacterium]|nr:ferrichrome ABC transporter permease [Thermoanaerobaculia bacterium]
MLAAGLTIFLGAFLLFQVEPLLAKAVLPWFGGAPSVWTTCLVFFQVALLGGYLYAHALIRRLSPRVARRMHLGLVLLSLAALVAPLAWGSLPLLPSAAWKPPDPANPIGRIVALLAAHVGLPFLLLSSTSPLLSAWIARARAGSPVYRLYAASNLGSLLALVTYPSLVERFLPLPSQALVWTAAFALFALGSLFCLWRDRATAERPAMESPAIDSAAQPETGRLPHGFWFAASACGSILLLASTNQMCQEVAAIPFLWVLPLSLYLLSFVLTFESDRI